MNDFSIKQYFNEHPYVPYVIAISIVMLLVILTIIIVYQRKYTIVFKCDDEIIDKKKAKKSSLLDLPTLEKKGKTFVGWFFDKELTNQAYIYTFPKQNLSLYAKFIDAEIEENEDLDDCEEIIEANTENSIEVSQELIDSISESNDVTANCDTETNSIEEVLDERPPEETNEVLVVNEVEDPNSLAEVIYEDNEIERKIDNFITVLKNSSLKNHEKFVELANNLLKYRKMTYRYTKRECIFKCHGVVVARVGFSGDNLKVYLALNIDDYTDSNVKMRNASLVKKYEGTPLLINLKTDKATKYLNSRLIDDLSKKFELTLKRGYQTQSYNRLVLALKDSPLIKSGREDMLRERINVLDVDVLSDDDAKSMFVYKSGVLSENVKNVQISTLEENFLPGSLIDLRQLKLKKLVSDDTLGIKIVGKGTLTKSFNVVCDDISLSAAKMILLTGGKVVLITEEV